MTPIVLTLICAAGPTDTWAGFRNDGSSRTTAANLPLTWSPTEHVAWRVPVPGYGQSSPVVWKGRVYVTAIDGAEKEKLFVRCLDLADGKTVWAKEFASTQKGKNNPMMSRAAPTPVADEAGVYAFFESGDLFALTSAGEVRWTQHLSKEYGELKNNHGLGGSLAQTADTVLALIDHQGPSYLLAVNKADGKTAWKADRPSRASWSTPVVNGSTVVASSSGAATGYDVRTGEKKWELDGLRGNNMPSPTVIDDMVILAAAEDRTKSDLEGSAKSNCCLRMAGSAGYEIVWRMKRVVGSTTSPLAHAGHVYIVDRAGVVNCVDLKTGEVKYSERLAGVPWATPVGAGDRVYFFGKDGVTTVLKTGPVYEKLATNRLWGEAEFKDRQEAAKKQATPPAGSPPGGMAYAAVGDVVYGVAAVDGAIVLRTGTEVICVR